MDINKHSFKQIVGNPLIVGSLQNAIKYNKISHSYIFEGQKSMGKKLLANTFAKALLCRGGGDLPCGECVSCKIFESGSHPDVIRVRPVKTVSLGIDDIREQIISTVNIKPYEYKYKVYIIEKADKMTPQAQNSLLKTIEQPPVYGVFLLVCDNLSSLLPTILSRCVIYKIKPLSRDTVKDFLAKNGIADETAEICASYSGGSIGAALRLSQDTGFKDFRDEVLGIAQCGDLGITSVFKNVKKIEKFKDNIHEALDIIYLWYRDALLYKLTSDAGFIAERDKLAELETFCKNRTLENILGGIDGVFDAKTAIGQNANFQLAMEVMFMRLEGL